MLYQASHDSWGTCHNSKVWGFGREASVAVISFEDTAGDTKLDDIFICSREYQWKYIWIHTEP